MRIIFMGTPDFADTCLKSLISAGHRVIAAFTRKDKPKGRKQLLTPPPVKVTALKNNIPVYQPGTLRKEDTVKLIKDLRPDIIVVAAYGMILPKAILDIPPHGCINIHASLLPKYRGAAPVQWSVINGEKETGVTSMKMNEGLDTGDMLLYKSTLIGSEETSSQLMERLSHIGADLMLETLEGVKNGTLKPIPQDNGQSTYASMLTKEIAKIDWNRTSGEIHNLIRGLLPWPVASTVYRGKKLKVYSSKIAGDAQGVPGSILPDKKKFTVICGKNTSLELTEVQYEGGKRMGGKDFLLGHPATRNDVL